MTMTTMDTDHSKMAFTGDLGRYLPVTTADGSLTFHSEHFRETFHSRDGAEGETRYNFAEGCEIASRARRLPPVILEVGLGMGRGYPATLEALGADYRGGMTFVSVEIDNALIDRCRQSVLPEWAETFPIYRDLEKFGEKEFFWWEAERQGRRLLVLPGNAVHTLPQAQKRKLTPPLNAIYQDAFSPRKNPELWTPEWFALLKSLSSPEVILSTYSASPSVRNALTEAGFAVEERKGFGRKRACFRARANPSAIHQKT